MSASNVSASKWVWQVEGERSAAFETEALAVADARSIIRSNWDRPDMDETTYWVDALIIETFIDEDGDEAETEGRISVKLDPIEPDCESGEEHDWTDGKVYSSQGCGLTWTDVCKCCGLHRSTDTGHQRRDNGEQHLTAIWYHREPA